MEQKIRKLAIDRYLKGESPKSIYTDLNRSKNWFFKWLKRYQSGEPNWYADRSRAPVNRPKAITASDRKRIIKTRLHLESQKYAQTGPSAFGIAVSSSFSCHRPRGRNTIFIFHTAESGDDA